MSAYVYITSERAGHGGAENDLFTVGFYNPATSRFMPESDHPTKEEAAQRVALLNGGDNGEALAALRRIAHVLNTCQVRWEGDTVLDYISSLTTAGISKASK